MTPRYNPHRPVAVATQCRLNNWEANVNRSDLERPIERIGKVRVLWVGNFGQLVGYSPLY